MSNFKETQDGQFEYVVSRDRSAREIERINAAAAKKAVAENRRLCQQIIDEFPDHLAFAIDECIAGSSLLEAQGNFCTILVEEIAEIDREKKRSQRSIGAAPLEHSEGGPDSISPGGLTELIKERAEEDKTSFAVAMRNTRKENPGMFVRPN